MTPEELEQKSLEFIRMPEGIYHPEEQDRKREEVLGQLTESKDTAVDICQTARNINVAIGDTIEQFRRNKAARAAKLAGLRERVRHARAERSSEAYDSLIDFIDTEFLKN